MNSLSLRQAPLIVICSCALCSGCVGGIARPAEIVRVEKPILSVDRARYVGSDLASEFPVPTKAQVLTAWGEPDIVEIVKPNGEAKDISDQRNEQKAPLKLGGVLLWGKAETKETPERPYQVTERWIYNDGPRWSGVWLQVLIFPIPALAPIWTNQMTVEFSGESVVAAETLSSATHYFFFYFMIYTAGGGEHHESSRSRFLGAKYLLAPFRTIGGRSDVPSKGDIPTKGDVPSGGDVPSVGEDVINCVSGGERKWVPRSKCD
jgi:hypothetical protein